MSKENLPKLEVVKTSEYVWRLTAFRTNADHSYIPVWWVVKVLEDGRRFVLAGGYSQGSNCESGKAKMPRRRDAMAWARGYLYALKVDDPANFRVTFTGGLYIGVNPYRPTRESRRRSMTTGGNRLYNHLGRLYDEVEAEFFQEGADRIADGRAGVVQTSEEPFSPRGSVLNRYNIRPLKEKDLTAA